MKNLIALTILSTLSLSAQTALAKSISVTGAKAQAIYVALGGNANAPRKGNVRTLAVSGVECSTQTETQQGDPEAKPEKLTFVICGATDSRGDYGDYLGTHATRLARALKRAGVTVVGTAINGSIKATVITCSKLTETQQGDPEAKPETLVMYSCEIQE